VAGRAGTEIKNSRNTFVFSNLTGKEGSNPASRPEEEEETKTDRLGGKDFSQSTPHLNKKKSSKYR